MTRLLAILWLWVMACLASPLAIAAQSASVDTGKVNARIISSHDHVSPGQTFHVALETVLDNHWHTYWKNPGDSGEPVHIRWELPESLSAGEIIWPLPMPIATGPLINYGFEGTPYFPVPFTLSEDAVSGETLNITAKAYYLVCYDVCIPEQAELPLSITVGPAIEDTLSKALIDNAILDAPKANAASGGIIHNAGDISVTVAGLPKGVDVTDSYFFPFETGYILAGAPQVVTAGDSAVQISSKADYLWDDSTPEVVNGVIRYKQDGEFRGEIISLKVGEAIAIGATQSAASQAGSAVTGGLFAALIGALIGGLILNLMPCVFPIISMKALSIASSGHGEVKTIRRDAWFYTFGVIVTFLGLTILLLSLKAAGAKIGWGFQLQSPILVGFLALLLFVIGLNLLGMFEIGGRLQNVGSAAPRKGARGAFFTGVLAVIVATPCTAPFMAGAVGYALTQPAIITLIIFLALAIGFALPFLMIAYMPALLKRLPKPGPWMVRFKEFLSFPMFGAAIWLVWVLTQQAGDTGLIIILSAMLLFALGLWMRKSPKGLTKALAIVAILASVALPVSLRVSASSAQSSDHAAVSTPWSSAAVQTALADGKTVFVDFTAAWCITCKVNERLVLSKPKVQARLSDDDVVFMVADWTNKNDDIAQELSRHGRSGVPLYLVYKPDDKNVSPDILPQTLTQNIVLSALK